MRLHSYFQSSASFRVRIALNIKGLAYEYAAVSLRRDGGEHLKPNYAALNPQRLVPTLVDGEVSVRQSLAILEYLDEIAPEPPLLPKDAVSRAHVRELAAFVACEIQPLNNLRVTRHLSETLGLGRDALKAWRRHWIALGFDALETMLASDPRTGTFCFGDQPTIADCCLVPQAVNAERADAALDLAAWPTIRRIYDACLALPAFERAHPKNQPDAAEERALVK